MTAGAAGARKIIKAAVAKLIEMFKAAAGGTTKKW